VIRFLAQEMQHCALTRFRFSVHAALVSRAPICLADYTSARMKSCVATLQTTARSHRRAMGL
jgi:hypothetical protein